MCSVLRIPNKDEANQRKGQKSAGEFCSIGFFHRFFAINHLFFPWSVFLFSGSVLNCLRG